ncbi:MAG: cryptochrome/photolyase family protein, partial [Poseidonia sp.]
MAQVVVSENSGLVLASEMSGPFGEAMLPFDASTVDTWVWLAYDQLNVAFLDALELQGKVGVILIESSHKAQRRPYHQQKLGVLLSNQRHFALELQA